LKKINVHLQLALRMNVKNRETGATAFCSGGARFHFCGAGFSLWVRPCKDQTPQAEQAAEKGSSCHSEARISPKNLSVDCT
jgi:hypothetical protein